ncbi:MAG TPA: hypothetical protein DCG62_10885 [Acinetobacter johnsonii]|nr:hypothetical protein [Acinetobacter johnsonii]
MSVKIKINWDNENVVSESVRIYRADSAFTSTNLPPLLAEIFDDVDEYEDLAVLEGLTYYYMLSAKLGDHEVFTECLEVSDTDAGYPKLISISNLKIILLDTSVNVNFFAISFFNDDGSKFFIDKARSSSNMPLSFNCIDCGTFFEIPSSPVFRSINLGITGRGIISVSFFNKGNNAIVCFFGNTTILYKIAIYECAEKYSLDGAVLLSNKDAPLNSFGNWIVSDDMTLMFHVSSDGTLTKYLINDSILTINYTVTQQTTYITFGDLKAFSFSRDGKCAIGFWGADNGVKSIKSFKLSEAFNFNSVIDQFDISISSSAENARINSTNRFINKESDGYFLILNNRNVQTSPKVLKERVTVSNW